MVMSGGEGTANKPLERAGMTACADVAPFSASRSAPRR
jgi:hypothetical protein